MRTLQNIVSTFGTIIARQGKLLVVRIEALRSLHAHLVALSSSASGLALGLRTDVWQGLCMTWLPSVVVPVVVKQSRRRHLIIGRHRTAA